MFPFWEVAIAPVLEAARARRIVEIGALRGENTRQMIERLGAGTELHVIDPLPDFDPAEHEREFAGQYIFHRDLSLNVLGDLPPMDAALIDGDHNWYTVYNECRLLAEVARRAGAPLPVMLLHDVGWPYGRRDLYYDPTNIPEEHRREWKRKGMEPGKVRLVPFGAGLNPSLANATVEGGRHNGVMTGLDDWMAEHDKPLRRVVLPIYFGLAIVVEEERLARQPALAAELDRLESAAGKDQLLELSEDIRIQALMFQHKIFFERQASVNRLAARYLEGVKRTLVDEHYPENGVRLEHLRGCVEQGTPLNDALLRDPVRNATVGFGRLQDLRRTGAPAPVPAGVSGYAPQGRPSLDRLQACLDLVREEYVRGDVVDCGVGRGAAGILARAYLEAFELTGRDVWLLDRYRADAGSDLNQVREAFDRLDVLDDRTHFVLGEPGRTAVDLPAEQYALIHLGSGVGPEAGAVLDALYPRLAPGGLVVVDDHAGPEVHAAVAHFRSRQGVTAPLESFGIDGCSWRRTDRPTAGGSAAEEAAPGTSIAPLARPATEPCDLSVVIVMHDMPREAQRSLHALSRRYQRGVEDLDYEVIVVENGSDPDQRLGEDLVRSFGPEFRYLDLGPDAPPSPAHALNLGVAASSGDAIALMVDGAHVVTPGVLANGMKGLHAYEPAVVATQQWYVGPGQQGDAQLAGYDQPAEDALFEQIGWPADGYRLFEIGHFIGDRDWFDGMWESNCLFVRRKQLEQVGGFDEAFDMPGGGYTNLDLYERLGSSPDVQIVSIIGEGSFHQVHGGTTTNQADPDERRRRVSSYAEHYAELRGRPFKGPERPIAYVGAFRTDAAKRSRARRMTASAFEVDPVLEGPDGPDARPMPVPDELRQSFTRAYWRSRAWADTAWLGHQVPNAPSDLLTYQELISEVRPDWIIETGTRSGGRALFLASVCDLIDHGRVVSVDRPTDDPRPRHDRITYLSGAAQLPEVVEQVRALVGPEPRALVVLGTRGRRDRMRQEFDAYAPMVPVGSYVVVEHTVLNGHPVDASFGPGPFEAVRGILSAHPEFVVDVAREKQAPTFNPSGFLRRTR